MSFYYKNCAAINKLLPHTTKESKPHAGFLSGWGNPSPVHPFKVWVQKVLPQVYDDSLSYQELVYKVMWYINTLIENCETTNANVELLRQAYEELEKYVNTYLDNFDLNAKFEQVLDDAVKDGTIFTTLLEHIYFGTGIQGYVGSENVVTTNTYTESYDNFIQCCADCEDCEGCTCAYIGDGETVTATYEGSDTTVVTVISRSGDTVTTKVTTTEKNSFVNLYSDFAEGDGINISPASSTTRATQTFSVDENWLGNVIVNSIKNGSGISVANNGDGTVTISTNLKSGTGISVAGDTISTNLTQGTGIKISGATISLDSDYVSGLIPDCDCPTYVQGDGVVFTTNSDGSITISADPVYVKETAYEVIKPTTVDLYYTTDGTAVTATGYGGFYTVDNPTLSEYVFIGWSTSNSSTTVTYSTLDGSTYVGYSALYAVFASDVVATYLNGIDGEIYASDSKSRYIVCPSTYIGNTFTMPTCSLSNSGYTFSGWLAEASYNTAISGSIYQAGTILTFYYPQTFTAQWTADATAEPYDVTFADYSWYMSKSTDDTAGAVNECEVNEQTNVLYVNAEKTYESNGNYVITYVGGVLPTKGCNKARVYVGDINSGVAPADIAMVMGSVVSSSDTSVTGDGYTGTGTPRAAWPSSYTEVGGWDGDEWFDAESYYEFDIDPSYDYVTFLARCSDKTGADEEACYLYVTGISFLSE